MRSGAQCAVTLPSDERSPGLDDKLRSAGYRLISLPERPRDHVWSDREIGDLFAEADVIFATSSLGYLARASFLVKVAGHPMAANSV